MKACTFDVIVVGGGPAGLTAAATLAEFGASVLIIEECEVLGGQYYRQRRGALLARHGPFRPMGASLIDAVSANGVSVHTGTVVWGADGDALLTSRLADGLPGRFSAPVRLICTGAYERSVPFPGWTLPGVVTPGCALHFAHIDRVAVGKRVVVAGSGPMLLPAACALLELGSRVLAVVENGAPYRPAAAVLPAFRHPARLVELAGYLARLSLHRVPLLQQWRVVQATGTGRVKAVEISPSGGTASTSRRLQVDALCVGYGFRPSAELPRLLGCACAIDPSSGDPVPVASQFGRTSVSGVWVAGEAMGIAGVHAAMARGRTAAYAIAAEMGLGPIPEQRIRSSLRELNRALRFARLVARTYSLPASVYASIPDCTTVCRCESVTALEIRAACEEAGRDLHAVKAVTRAGMGLCQGRQCGNTIAALVGDFAGESLRPRMPLKPISFPIENTAKREY